MLVLSRRVDEEIVLPDLGISFKVIQNKGNQVRIGITAPDNVRILRGELVWDQSSPKSSASPTSLSASLPIGNLSALAVNRFITKSAG